MTGQNPNQDSISGCVLDRLFTQRGLFNRLTAWLMVLTVLLVWLTSNAAESSENEVWIDVRSTRDYREGHLEGAINIPHGDIGHKIFAAVPDMFKVVHIYDGSSGTFAGLALEMLMEIGYQEVINEGGYEDLVAKLQP